MTTKQTTQERAAKMNNLATGIFAPIYPLTAADILRQTGMATGHCLDLGCGPGSLAIALAASTTLRFTLLDPCQEMLRHALQNIYQTGQAERFKIRPGNAEKLPLPDQSIELVVSRGSIFFWEDLPTAFCEIHRVLVPGGKAYLGGGLGNRQTEETISRQMLQIDPNWNNPKRVRQKKENKQPILETLRNTPFQHQVIEDETGFWILLQKEM